MKKPALMAVVAALTILTAAAALADSAGSNGHPEGSPSAVPASDDSASVPSAIPDGKAISGEASVRPNDDGDIGSPANEAGDAKNDQPKDNK